MEHLSTICRNSLVHFYVTRRYTKMAKTSLPYSKTHIFKRMFDVPEMFNCRLNIFRSHWVTLYFINVFFTEKFAEMECLKKRNSKREK